MESNENKRKISIFLTEDGSHSLQVPELDETYHSSHGAIQESNHVFIKNGLAHWLQKNTKKEIKIFEVGIGTGLNSLLTAIEAEKLKTRIKYHGIELYPLEKELTSKLNYSTELNQSAELFAKLHKCNWEEQVEISEFYSILKTEASFKDYKPKTQYDLIYFDAFAPSKQPEMWEYPTIEKCYKMLNPNGVFVTYSAKGQLKRDLKKAGFSVESIPGPPGKFEMVRASKLSAEIQ